MMKSVLWSTYITVAINLLICAFQFGNKTVIIAFVLCVACGLMIIFGRKKEEEE